MSLAEDEAQLANRAFFDPLWRDAKLIGPERFNTWGVVQELVATHSKCLEIGPGLRPRLPLEGTTFVDLSPPAVEALQKAGAHAIAAPLTALPFEDGAFDLVSALDIIEHVDDDVTGFREISRVTRKGGAFLLAVPLFASCWTGFDDLVGHCRRYEPEDLQRLLKENHFTIEKSAIFGMQPKSPKVVNLAMWVLNWRREWAMRWYNNVFMPIGLSLQKPLLLSEGFVNDPQMDQVFLLCRKE